MHPNIKDHIMKEQIIKFNKHIAAMAVCYAVCRRFLVIVDGDGRRS
jgi:hypothetical protein